MNQQQAARQGERVAYHAMITTIKTGVDKEGRVLARDITCYMDGGAYSSTGPIATSVPFLSMEQAYRMENVRYNGYRIYTNKPIRGMIRVHGRSFACGIDTQLDMIAEHLNIDPVTMRMRNAREVGDTTCTGSHIGSCAMKETIAPQKISTMFIPSTRKLRGKYRKQTNSKGISAKLVAQLRFRIAK